MAEAELDGWRERALRLGAASQAERDSLAGQVGQPTSSVAQALADCASRIAAGALDVEGEAVRDADGGRGDQVVAEEEGGAFGDASDHIVYDSSAMPVSDADDDDDVAEDGDAETIGIVIDLHYLQVAASSFSLATTWSVPDFEKALIRACGGGNICLRIACDSCQYDVTSKTLPENYVCLSCGKPGHWIKDCPSSTKSAGPLVTAEGAQSGVAGRSKEAFGKSRLHAALSNAGYRLVLSPNKAITNAQGATDIDVACSMFEVAGAFSSAPAAQVLALVAGDADFKPVISAVLQARRDTLRVVVFAERSLLSNAYLEWLGSGGHLGVDSRGQSMLRTVRLSQLLSEVAPSVIDLRGAQRPRDPVTGRTDVAHVARETIAMAGRVTATAAENGDQELITLNLSGKGAPWGDDETIALVAELKKSPSTLALLSGLWLHHTDVGDGSCASIATLLPLTPQLKEVHLSDSNVTLEGVRELAFAARAAIEVASACASTSSPPRRLYVNARHLGGSAAVSLAADFTDCMIIRLLAARPMFGSPGGKGKGSKGGMARGEVAKGGRGHASSYGGGRGGSHNHMANRGRGSRGGRAHSPGNNGRGRGGKSS